MLDINQYKKVLSQFPTGVCVITTTKETGYSGITVNSFASVSLDPPLILWSIDKSTHCLDDFLESKSFAISFLSSKQQSVSNHFASKGYFDKFQDVETILHKDLPVIDNSVGFIICNTEKVIEAGDHYIVLGAVVQAERSGINESDDALTYYQSEYRDIK